MLLLLLLLLLQCLSTPAMAFLVGVVNLLWEQVSASCYNGSCGDEDVVHLEIMIKMRGYLDPPAVIPLVADRRPKLTCEV